MIKFHVPSVPVAQPRPRAVIAHGGLGARIHEVTHTGIAKDGTRKPHPIAAFKASVRHEAEAVYKGPPLDGPVAIEVTFLMPRPGRLVWKKRPMPRLRHIIKPDIDNLLKAVKDALKGILWRDDSQVAEVYMEKLYASGDEQPGVDVEILQIAEEVAS